MTFQWTPPSYGYTRLRVRRNPNGSVFEPIMPMDDRDVLITANGDVLGGAAEDALAQLNAAGPRGAAALGVLAGFLFSGWKAAIAGGVLGYFGGKYLTNIASKALTVATTVDKVETTVAKATS
jgi:hypothetical protein